MNRRDIPNLITFLRLLLIVPIIWYFQQRDYGAVLALFVIAGASDALDGYLARKNQWTSHLGGWLDPLADKAMLVTVYLLLAWHMLIPMWLLIAVILRDLVILSGGLYYYFRIERVSAAPRILSKLNTLMQIILVVVILLGQSVWEMPQQWIDILVRFVLLTTVLSGLDYVITWSIKAWKAKSHA